MLMTRRESTATKGSVTVGIILVLLVIGVLVLAYQTWALAQKVAHLERTWNEGMQRGGEFGNRLVTTERRVVALDTFLVSVCRAGNLPQSFGYYCGWYEGTRNH